MGLAVRASRLLASWVFISFIAIGIGLPAAQAAGSGSASKPKQAAPKQAAVKKAAPKQAAVKKAAPKQVAKAAARKPAVRATKSTRQVKRAPQPARRAAQASKRTKHRAPAKRARKQPQPAMPDIGGDVILSGAARFLGTPYRRGGTTDRGVDCSGLVRRVFSEVGVDLPHSARAQFTMGSRVDASNLQPGDLVFFRIRRAGASHVGIYVGDRLFIHAAYLGREVRLDSLDDRYYRARYLGARRLHHGRS